MVEKELQTQILTELEQLPVAAQGRVLEFVQSLSGATHGPALTEKTLADMFGLIGDEDADDMEEAIEEAFGMVAAER